jgi:hypothetical protein
MRGGTGTEYTNSDAPPQIPDDYSIHAPRGLGLGLPSHPSPNRGNGNGNGGISNMHNTSYGQEMTDLPITPRLQREPSGESINIFADPGSIDRSASTGSYRESRQHARASSNTTFTDLMERMGRDGNDASEYPTPRSFEERERYGGERLSPARYTPDHGRSPGRRLV